MNQTSLPRSPFAWIAVFVTGLTAIWVTLVFGEAMGAWWDDVSSALATPEEFRTWVEGLGAWGPVAFFLAQAAQVIIVPIPGTLFPPVGALAFGPWPALGLSLAGMALGSAIVFLVARRWGRPLATRLVGEDLIHRYENLMTARGGLLIWLVFLIPLLPDDAICALAGLSGIPFRRFMVIAVVGRVPAVAMGVFTMAGLEGSPAWVWALVTVLAAVALWAGLRYRDVLEQRLLKAMRRGGDSGHSRSDPPLVQEGPVAQQVESVRSSVGTVEQKTLPRSTRDPLVPVLGAVVATTSVAVLIGVLAGVSGLASGIILIWGVALAVVVAWPRGDG